MTKPIQQQVKTNRYTVVERVVRQNTRFDVQRNSVWLGVEWEVRRRVDRVRRNNWEQLR